MGVKLEAHEDVLLIWIGQLNKKDEQKLMKLFRISERTWSVDECKKFGANE